MEAIERVIAGPERKSRLINENEKKIIAYHEAGHAVVINALPEADTVQKVSIISRGEAGGYTMAFPEEDRVLKSRSQIMSDMIGLLGGRAAEDIVFSDITSGASNDLERVTKLARMMVMRLGMSEELGPMVYGKKEELVFLGREISEQRDFSEHIAQKIDSAIQKIVQEAYQQSKAILSKYREELDKVAHKLLEVETLSADQFYEIFPTPVNKTGGIPEKVA
jgi:cell division protease FtsH